MKLAVAVETRQATEATEAAAFTQDWDAIGGGVMASIMEEAVSIWRGSVHLDDTGVPDTSTRQRT